jgi:uncharacterized protein YkwD
MARAAAAEVKPWLAYQDRLTTRLDDAGGGKFDPDFAKTLLVHTNRFRASQGLGALAWDDGLAASASAHVADLIARGYFAHESPEGFTHVDRVSLLSRDFCGQTGENLAWRDYPMERTVPQQFQTMWENSPDHRQNLANPSFSQAGYGIVRNGRAVYAAGVYATDGIRLGAPLPLNIKTNAELAGSITGASPNIERLSLTAPFEHPTWMATPSQALPPLAPGVWQLRPLQPVGGSRFDVLTGPLFQIG